MENEILEVKTTIELWEDAEYQKEHKSIKSIDVFTKHWVSLESLEEYLKEYWDILVFDKNLVMAGAVAVIKGKIESLHK